MHATSLGVLDTYAMPLANKSIHVRALGVDVLRALAAPGPIGQLYAHTT